MFELVVIWWDNERDVFLYSSREEAEKGGEQMTMAFGDQIVWYGVRRRIQQRVR